MSDNTKIAQEKDKPTVLELTLEIQVCTEHIKGCEQTGDSRQAGYFYQKLVKLVTQLSEVGGYQIVPTRQTISGHFISEVKIIEFVNVFYRDGRYSNLQVVNILKSLMHWDSIEAQNFCQRHVWPKSDSTPEKGVVTEENLDPRLPGLQELVKRLHQEKRSNYNIIRTIQMNTDWGYRKAKTFVEDQPVGDKS